MRSHLTTFLCLMLALAAGSSLLRAANPELSAELITADLKTNEHVAKGDARLQHEEVVVEADEIRFNQGTGVVTATGRVRVTRRGVRIVSERITYNVETGAFTSGRFRAGTPPVFAEGESFSGNLDEFEMTNARFYYLEPDRASPTLSLEQARIRPGESVAGDGVHLRLPLLGSIPLPAFERDLDAPSLSFSGAGGFRNNLGAYVQSEILFPLDDNLRVGANFDLYSRRGVLLGPALRYQAEDAEGTVNRLSLSSGWIADQGAEERGFDVLGRPVPIQRYLGDLSALHRTRDLEVVLQTTLLSDSEVERDFREDRFNSEPHPESFLELTQLIGHDIFLSVFVERNPNPFFRNLERAPEITLEVPYRPIGESGLVHALKARYARIRAWGQTYPDAYTTFLRNILPQDTTGWPTFDPLVLHTNESWAQLAELNYAVRYPLALGDWSTFTPLAEVGFYATRAGELPSNRFDWLDALGDDNGVEFATGFDWEATAYGDFKVESRTWDITALRHLLQPVLQFRYFQLNNQGSPLGNFFPSFDTTRPELDLLLRRDRPNGFENEFFLRAGLRNTLLATGHDEHQRELLTLGLFYDHSWRDMESRDGKASAGYIELAATPARWLEIRFDQRIGLAEGERDETRVRAILRSAEVWQLELAVDYFEKVYHQYRLEGFYRVGPRTVLIAGWRYDALSDGRLTRQVYGLRYQLGKAWEFESAIVLRAGAEREDDVGFEASVRLLSF